jgi:hypothetical protein
MHRFALVPLDAVCAGDHRPRPKAQATGRLDGARHPVSSLERVIGQ